MYLIIVKQTQKISIKKRINFAIKLIRYWYLIKLITENKPIRKFKIILKCKKSCAECSLKSPRNKTEQEKEKKEEKIITPKSTIWTIREIFL